MSASWKASVPISDVACWPVIATTDRSMCASASAVTRFTAPGPDVAMHTPTCRRLRVADRGVASTLLVADQDVAHLLRVQQRVVRGEDGSARD